MKVYFIMPYLLEFVKFFNENKKYGDFGAKPGVLSE